MSFDGLVTRAVVHELQDALAGGRVTKFTNPVNMNFSSIYVPGKPIG